MSIDNLRIGKNYFLRNFGDSTSFLVLDTTGANDFFIKDLLTLETYKLSELFKYGFGKDFDLYELE